MTVAHATTLDGGVKTLALATSDDAMWAAAREGRTIALLERCRTIAARVELASDDIDFALVGPPTTLAIMSRTSTGGSVELYLPPSTTDAAAPPTLVPATQLALEVPARLVATTGPFFAVVSPNALHALFVRSAGHALSSQLPDVEGPIERVVGLERDRFLFLLRRKLEVFDAASCRPLSRPQWPLPPPPRVLGAAFGHLWAMRENGDSIVVYRLSDSRPFQHDAGAQIDAVISHPLSPVIALVTAGSVLRLHCHAHSVTPIHGIPDERGAMAIIVDGEEQYLTGFSGLDREPWRVRVTRPS